MSSVVMIITFLQISANVLEKSKIFFKNYHHILLCCKKYAAECEPLLNHTEFFLGNIFLLLQPAKSKRFHFGAVLQQHFLCCKQQKSFGNHVRPLALFLLVTLNDGMETRYFSNVTSKIVFNSHICIELVVLFLTYMLNF